MEQPERAQPADQCTAVAQREFDVLQESSKRADLELQLHARLEKLGFTDEIEAIERAVSIPSP